MTPTHHALLHSISTYLTFIKQRLTTALGDCTVESTANWLRWGSRLEDLREITETLCEIMSWVSRKNWPLLYVSILTSLQPLGEAKAQALPSRGSSVLSHLYTHLLAHHSTGSPVQQRSPRVLALAYILSQASKPFMTLLHQWVGLTDSSALDDIGDPDSQPWADLGISRSQLPPRDGIDVHWQYEFSAKRMPTFIPKESRRTLFEAGRSLRLLRDASDGQHPLCGTSWGIEVDWKWGVEGSIRCV